jgi:hypothetical protein
MQIRYAFAAMIALVVVAHTHPGRAADRTFFRVVEPRRDAQGRVVVQIAFSHFGNAATTGEFYLHQKPPEWGKAPVKAGIPVGSVPMKPGDGMAELVLPDQPWLKPKAQACLSCFWNLGSLGCGHMWGTGRAADGKDRLTGTTFAVPNARLRRRLPRRAWKPGRW